MEDTEDSKSFGLYDRISSTLITATICCSNPMEEMLALEASQCGFESLLQYQKQEEPKWGKF